MTRREAREQAFLLIFEKSFRPESMEEIIQDAVEARAIREDAFSKEVACGVYDKSGELDGIIEAHLINWGKKRVSRVALSLLRMAVYEMKYISDVPVSVSINEAVELAKKYAGEEDSAFVNGVLGSVARQQQEAAR